jgi:hypothetical protein
LAPQAEELVQELLVGELEEVLELAVAVPGREAVLVALQALEQVVVLAGL